jgi:hypothetical protein
MPGLADMHMHPRDEEKRIGPTIYSCGPILYGPAKDPQGVVREQKAQGFDFVKLYSFVWKGEFHEAITTAKKLDMYTAGHIWNYLDSLSNPIGNVC